MTTPDPIAAACAAERERLGLSYRNLARLAGYQSHGWLRDWLAGQSTVQTDTAGRVMDALGLEVRRQSSIHHEGGPEEH